MPYMALITRKIHPPSCSLGITNTVRRFHFYMPSFARAPRNYRQFYADETPYLPRPIPPERPQTHCKLFRAVSTEFSLFEEASCAGQAAITHRCTVTTGTLIKGRSLVFYITSLFCYIYNTLVLYQHAYRHTDDAKVLLPYRDLQTHLRKSPM